MTALTSDIACNKGYRKTHILPFCQSGTFGGTKVLVPGTITMVPPPFLEGFWHSAPIYASAQCAFWVVRWPSSQKLKSKNTLSDGKKNFWGYFSYVVLGRKLQNLFCFSFSGTGNIIFGTLKIGQNDPEIPNLEFESHGFLQNHVFLPTEQAETNICWIIYQDATFEICLSLFGWKENILDKMHIVQWC